MQTQPPSSWTRVILLAWAVAFAALVRIQVSETWLGAVTFTVAIWAGFYPFVTTTTLPIRRYWLMLAVSTPVVLLLHELDGSSFAAFGSAVIAVIALWGVQRNWQRRRHSLK